MSKIVIVRIELDEADALALSQFAKRLTWSGMRAYAKDDQEADEIRSGIERLAFGLADVGFDPR